METAMWISPTTITSRSTPNYLRETAIKISNGFRHTSSPWTEKFKILTTSSRLLLKETVFEISQYINNFSQTPIKTTNQPIISTISQLLKNTTYQPTPSIGTQALIKTTNQPSTSKSTQTTIKSTTSAVTQTSIKTTNHTTSSAVTEILVNTTYRPTPSKGTQTQMKTAVQSTTSQNSSTIETTKQPTTLLLAASSKLLLKENVFEISQYLNNFAQGDTIKSKTNNSSTTTAEVLEKQNKLAIIDDLNDIVDMKSEILQEYEKKFAEQNSKEANLYSGKNVRGTSKEHKKTNELQKMETDSFVLKRNKLN